MTRLFPLVTKMAVVVAAWAWSFAVMGQVLHSSDDANAPTHIQSGQMTGRPDREVFLERDVDITRGDSNFRADKATYWIAEDEIEASVRRRESFALETTLSGLGYLRHIRRWRALGYRVILYFLTLPDVETAIARVAERVRQGGHDIPEATIRRRFVAGLRNFEQHYRQCVDEWATYDNSTSTLTLLAWGEKQ